MIGLVINQIIFCCQNLGSPSTAKYTVEESPRPSDCTEPESIV